MLHCSSALVCVCVCVCVTCSERESKCVCHHFSLFPVNRIIETVGLGASESICVRARVRERGEKRGQAFLKTGVQIRNKT